MCTKNEALLSDSCQNLMTSEMAKNTVALAGAKAPLGHKTFRKEVRTQHQSYML